MFDLEKVKGIIFDYGGTIDSNGKHWAEVLWDFYQTQKVPVTKQQFRDAYVYAERYLATHTVITPDDNFYEVLKAKMELQMNYLISGKILSDTDKINSYTLAISCQSYNFVRDVISKEKDVLSKLHARYSMVLVSNFYGNIHTVLEDFGLLEYFDSIIESAVVGVRKPDPAIFALGIEKINIPGENVAVIGDSYSKDIVPARENGCQTVWLKGLGWDEDEESATADAIITDFMELNSVFNLR